MPPVCGANIQKIGQRMAAGRSQNARRMTRTPNGAGDEPVLIELSGEYDLARRDELEQQLSSAYTAAIAVIDLRDVTYIDSTALACLIRLKKRMTEHGPAIVQLRSVQPQVFRVFELTQLDKVFEVLP